MEVFRVLLIYPHSPSGAALPREHAYVIYVTWAGGIRLICTHKPEGVQCLRASVDISGKSQLHMLYVTLPVLYKSAEFA